MSSVRRARSASVASTCSRRFFSRITCCERRGFDHRFGSAACFSISANCGRILPVSKILPKFVDLLAELVVFLFQFLIHEGCMTLLRVLGRTKRAMSAPNEIIAQRSEEHTSELQSHSFISYAV